MKGAGGRSRRDRNDHTHVRDRFRSMRDEGCGYPTVRADALVRLCELGGCKEGMRTMECTINRVAESSARKRTRRCELYAVCTSRQNIRVCRFLCSGCTTLPEARVVHSNRVAIHSDAAFEARCQLLHSVVASVKLIQLDQLIREDIGDVLHVIVAHLLNRWYNVACGESRRLLLLRHGRGVVGG